MSHFVPDHHAQPRDLAMTNVIFRSLLFWWMDLNQKSRSDEVRSQDSRAEVHFEHELQGVAQALSCHPSQFTYACDYARELR